MLIKLLLLLVTVVVVSGQVLLVNEQVMVSIQLPELTVNDVEVFVAEVLSDLINVLLVFEKLYGVEQVRPSQLRNGDLTGPRPIDAVVNTGNDSVNVSRVELRGFLKERQSRMRLHHVLHQGNEVFRRQPNATASGQDVDESRRGVVASRGHTTTTN